MPSPVEGSIYTKGTLKTLTFILGFNLTPLTTRTGKLVNLTTNNNFSYANAAITVADNATGTVTILANLSESGEYMAQFSANNATLKDYGPEFFFKVVDPILSGL